MDAVMTAAIGPFVVRPGRVSASEGRALFETLSTDSIAALVNQFYLDVLSDPDLGPIFARTIEPGGWDRHLNLMIDFWTSIMLASGRYKGSPLAVHSRIPGLRPEHFVQWLEIFDATAEMLFATEPAASLKEKARRIGRTLSTNLFWGADGKQAVDL
jgi:hemoglobin